MGKTTKDTTQNKKKRFSLVTRIFAIAFIPLMLLAVVLTVVGVFEIKSGMQSESMEGIKASLAHLEGIMNALDGGDFSLDSQDNLLKGSYNLTENDAMLDSLVEGTDVDFTLFYGKTRRATTLIDKETNQRMLGSDASDAVYSAVVEKGETLEAYDLPLNGEQYYAYYKPMKNSDGTIVGMYFAGYPAANVSSFISSKTVLLIGCALVIGLISVLTIGYTSLHMRKSINEANEAISSLAAGNLNVKVHKSALKRSDELGDIARGVHSLQNELIRVMSKVKESSQVLFDAGKELSSMASQTSSTADDIGHAVEDISKGAVSQAEEIETASARISEMGSVISRIVDSVGTLDETSEDMKSAGDYSTSIINDLSRSNDKTMEAIDRIGRQVNATNDSANKISEAIEIITNIAEETNLLSLNASIEAARAGEQGKGFAVVANQIQKLAEQSNESAQKIAEIIKELLDDSEHTVAVMNEVQEIMNEQQEKLQQTKSQFNDVSRGIDLSRDETNGIKGQTTLCDSARNTVVDVISNLSAISQQNAASTQETTASMQELNATINLLAASASDLTKLSEDLEGEIQFFRF